MWFKLDEVRKHPTRGALQGGSVILLVGSQIPVQKQMFKAYVFRVDPQANQSAIAVLARALGSLRVGGRGGSGGRLWFISGSEEFGLRPMRDAKGLQLLAAGDGWLLAVFPTEWRFGWSSSLHGAVL